MKCVVFYLAFLLLAATLTDAKVFHTACTRAHMHNLLQFTVFAFLCACVLHQDGDVQQVLQDGQISRKEWKAGFRLLDENGDGFITREELNGAIDILKVLDIDSYKMQWWKTWRTQASKGSSSHPAAGEDSGTTLTQIMNVCGNAHGAHTPRTHNTQHKHALKHSCT